MKEKDKIIKELQKEAEALEKSIQGWWIDYQNEFLWAKYEGGAPLGNVVGINLKRQQILLYVGTGHAENIMKEVADTSTEGGLS